MGGTSAGGFDAEIADGEEREKRILRGEEFAGALEAVDDADDGGDDGAALLDGGDGLHRRAAGGQDVVDYGDAPAGFEDALDALLAAVALGLFADEEALHGQAGPVVADDGGGRQRQRPDLEPANGLDAEGPGRLVE